MRVSWRLGLRILLIAVVAALIWGRYLSPHRATKAPVPSTRDLSQAMPMNAPGGGPAPEEAYEIYSALYQAPMPEALAFAENSVTDIPQVDGSCLKPTTPAERAMTDAFMAGNKQSHQWAQKFSIPQGYRLVSGAETPQMQNCLGTHGRAGPFCEQYKRFTYLRLLGIPGVDPSRTHALVSVIKSCGHLCGTGGIFAVAKTKHGWERSETTDFTRDCSWMY